LEAELANLKKQHGEMIQAKLPAAPSNITPHPPPPSPSPSDWTPIDIASVLPKMTPRSRIKLKKLDDELNAKALEVEALKNAIQATSNSVEAAKARVAILEVERVGTTAQMKELVKQSLVYLQQATFMKTVYQKEKRSMTESGNALVHKIRVVKQKMIDARRAMKAVNRVIEWLRANHVGAPELWNDLEDESITTSMPGSIASSEDFLTPRKRKSHQKKSRKRRSPRRKRKGKQSIAEVTPSLDSLPSGQPTPLQMKAVDEVAKPHPVEKIETAKSSISPPQRKPGITTEVHDAPPLFHDTASVRSAHSETSSKQESLEMPKRVSVRHTPVSPSTNGSLMMGDEITMASLSASKRISTSIATPVRSSIHGSLSSPCQSPAHTLRSSTVYPGPSKTYSTQPTEPPSPAAAAAALPDPLQVQLGRSPQLSAPVSPLSGSRSLASPASDDTSRPRTPFFAGDQKPRPETVRPPQSAGKLYEKSLDFLFEKERKSRKRQASSKALSPMPMPESTIKSPKPLLMKTPIAQPKPEELTNTDASDSAATDDDGDSGSSLRRPRPRKPGLFMKIWERVRKQNILLRETTNFAEQDCKRNKTPEKRNVSTYCFANIGPQKRRSDMEVNQEVVGPWDGSTGDSASCIEGDNTTEADLEALWALDPKTKALSTSARDDTAAFIKLLENLGAHLQHRPEVTLTEAMRAQRRQMRAMTARELRSIGLIARGEVTPLASPTTKGSPRTIRPSRSPGPSKSPASGRNTPVTSPTSPAKSPVRISITSNTFSGVA